MSKTYRRTNRGYKTDWLPDNPIYINRLNDIKETEESLIKFIDETEVYPITYEREYYCFEKDEEGKPYFTKVLRKVTHYRNLSEVNEAKQKLEVLQWAKKYPQKAHLIGDWFAFQYSKNPSWWNHDFCIVPGRSRTKEKLRAIKKGELDPDDVCWDDYKKPCPYYW